MEADTRRASDALIIGTDHEDLVSADQLAKAGLRVAVHEDRRKLKASR